MIFFSQAEIPLSFTFQKLNRMELTLREDRIVWPGGLRQKPTGLMIPTHLKAITVPEKPFVYARRLDGQETVVVQGEDDFATSNMDEGERGSERI